MLMPYTYCWASAYSKSGSCSLAAAEYHLERQLRQKPDRFDVLHVATLLKVGDEGAERGSLGADLLIFGHGSRVNL